MERLIIARGLCVFQVRFDDELCVNVINEIGFGSDNGEVKVRGGSPEADFVLPSTPAENSVTTFEKSNLREELNFDWFKFNVICIAQQWICDKYPVNASNLKLS